ncbi:MAG TPA: D-alanyl-D-alanine carboxypeptidase family protein [Thermoanaerobaculia bacterium]|nr:D-alanyl-D-alanine carboxypeptidase family protein [Thermoanaerobaculia bacterium]
MNPLRKAILSAIAGIVLLCTPQFSAAAPACRGELVIEPATLLTLHERNADRPLPTASTIKMLTALVAVDAIEAGEVAWDTPYTVSYDAALVGGSQVYLKQGETFPLRELLRATLIESANDAAFAVAEAVAGSEEAFVRRMRAKAEELGIEGARIHSPNGLPSKEGSRFDDAMTPRDMARIGVAVMRHPELREWVRTPLAGFRDDTFQLFNFNYLLRRYDGAEGIKTGYHRRADFNLVSAATRNGVRLIAVAMGCERKAQLFDRSEQLLDAGFADYRPVTVLARGERLRGRALVAGGRSAAVPVLAGDSVQVMSYRGRAPEIQTLVLSSQREAPVRPGEAVGKVVVRRGGRVVAEVPAVAATGVEEAPWWRRLSSRLLSFFA